MAETIGKTRHPSQIGGGGQFLQRDCFIIFDFWFFLSSKKFPDITSNLPRYSSTKLTHPTLLCFHLKGLRQQSSIIIGSGFILPEKYRTFWSLKSWLCNANSGNAEKVTPLNHDPAVSITPLGHHSAIQRHCSVSATSLSYDSDTKSLWYQTIW
jgi:hypothetical protein